MSKRYRIDELIGSSELYHHGIKGQKWGRRRFQNEDGSLTPAGKERYDDDSTDSKQRNETPEERKKRIARNVAIGTAAAATAIAVIGYMKYRSNSKALDKISSSAVKDINTKLIDVKSLSSKDTIISKGTKFQRISSRSFEDYSEKGRQIYASYLKSDNSIYMHDMPKNIESWRKSGIIKDGGSSVYKHTLEMNKDIKVASPRKVFEAYQFATGDKEPKQYKYQNFITGLVDRDKEENKTFINKLIEMGYNAIVDDNDAGAYTKSPLILLQPSADVKNVNTAEIKKIHKILNILMYKK